MVSLRALGLRSVREREAAGRILDGLSMAGAVGKLALERIETLLGGPANSDIAGGAEIRSARHRGRSG